MFNHEALFGIILQTALFFIGGWRMVLKNEWSNKQLKERVLEMQNELKKLAEVITIQAVQSQRLDNMASQLNSVERRVEDLRRGNGFVQRGSGTDGEYPRV